MNSQDIAPCTKIKILMLPDFRNDNPYQSLLSQGLAQEQIQVEFWYYYLNYFPILRGVLKNQPPAVDIVHLHWLDFYINAPKKGYKFLACIKFLLDIILVRMLGVKIVWTVHNQVSHDDKFSELRMMDPSSARNLSAGCSITPSPFLAALLAPLLVLKTASVLFPWDTLFPLELLPMTSLGLSLPWAPLKP